MVVGILGGGQLARMLALAGHPMGIRCVADLIRHLPLRYEQELPEQPIDEAGEAVGPTHKAAANIAVRGEVEYFDIAEAEDLGRLGELRCRLGRDLIVRVQSVEVGHVAVGVFGVVFIFEPFLELAVLSDLVGSNSGIDFLQFCSKVFIHIENFSCFSGILKQVSDDLVIHGRPHNQSPQLGRIGWT